METIPEYPRRSIDALNIIFKKVAVQAEKEGLIKFTDEDKVTS